MLPTANSIASSELELELNRVHQLPGATHSNKSYTYTLAAVLLYITPRVGVSLLVLCSMQEKIFLKNCTFVDVHHLAQ